MDNNELAKSILKLQILTQNACEEFEKDNKKSQISQKIKVLFMINEFEKVSPSVLINKLHIAKSNIALLCKQLILEQMITFVADIKDKRIIYYNLTEKGKTFLDEKLGKIQNNTIACCNNSQTLITQINNVTKALSKKF